jgi:hypothetical protein
MTRPEGACLGFASAPPPRTRFTSSEDAQLRSLVARYGDNKWGVVAFRMHGRTARACRDRWFNHLSPTLATAEWTPAEDALLLSLQTQHGNRWVRIAASFPNRTDPMVKNRFLALQRQRAAPALGFSRRAVAIPWPSPQAAADCAEAETKEEIQAAGVDEPPAFSSLNEIDSWFFQLGHFENDGVT